MTNFATSKTKLTKTKYSVKMKKLDKFEDFFYTSSKKYHNQIVTKSFNNIV